MSPSKESPDPQVKLPLSIKHGLLYVLLDNPVGIDGSGEDELLNIFDVTEDLNALALVKGGRLDKPDIIFTVLIG
jgi:hypothetical protein